MILEDEADPPVSERGQFRLGQGGRVLAIEHDPPARRRFQGADDGQQRALARAAGAEHRQTLARVQLKRHVAEHQKRLAAGGIVLGDMLDR